MPPPLLVKARNDTLSVADVATCSLDMLNRNDVSYPQYLVEEHLPILIKKNGWTQLMWATSWNNTPVVDAILAVADVKLDVESTVR